MTTLLTHGERQFQAMAYHDAIQGDTWAVELAELVDGELGPAIVTALFGEDPPTTTRVLTSTGDLPLEILRAFMVAIAAEETRIRAAQES
ncbi:hypothetical protein [Longispora fulva]|uniref:hypothetical protein n=1 Tax=Longispora fulva TaxID=619741 RepID=UPI0018C9438C|nr:hypothetical protein [Longispora fulva]